MALNGNGGQQLRSLGAPLVGLRTRDGGLDARPDLIGLDPSVLEGIEPIGDSTSDLEAIAALRPDLIVGYVLPSGEANVEPAERERLEQIAPTVFPPTFAPVDEVMTAFGALLGVDAQVTEQQQAYEERLADLSVRLPYDPADLTVSTVYLDEGLGINGRSLSTLTYVLDALGVSWSAATDAADAADGQLAVSFERVGELDTSDVIFRHAFTEPGPSILALSDPLPAGRAGQIIDEPNIFGQTYATYEVALDFLESNLLELNADVVP